MYMLRAIYYIFLAFISQAFCSTSMGVFVMVIIILNNSFNETKTHIHTTLNVIYFRQDLALETSSHGILPQAI